MYKTAKHCGIASQQTNNEVADKPTPLDVAIRNVVRLEEFHEDFVEKATYVPAVDGKVRIPRSNHYANTDKGGILLFGTDDLVFKDFVDRSLLTLFYGITRGKQGAWRAVNAPRRILVMPGPVYELTELGQRVMQACFAYEADWAIAYMHHVFHPKVVVMLRAMSSHALTARRFGVAGRSITQERALVQALDRIVRFVRRVANSWRFINVLKAHERQEQDNFDSAREFIYYQASGHSKLLILRIDLYYKPYHDVDGADRAAHNFLRWLRSPACRRNVLPSYLGFLVKRENGLVRGMHYHVMVVCNGNEQRSAYYLTHQLGEQWAKLTGQGPGSSHNCYADHQRYEFNGLGVMGLDAWEKMAGVRAALWYMSKQDFVIKATNSKVKNFWRSPIPKKVRKKLGRPRVAEDPLKLLRRMLGGKRSKVPPGISPRSATSSARTACNRTCQRR